MNIEIEVQAYSLEHGISLNYEDGYAIEVEIKKNEAVVAANRAGLMTLARALLTLAQEDVPPGCYLDFDEWSGLETGSSRISFIKSVKLSNSSEAKGSPIN